jgi:membrane protease YdiL (CAAX protease family)
MLLLGIWVPMIAIRSSRHLAAGMPMPPRRTLFTRTIFLLAILAFAACVVAYTNEMDLFPRFVLRPVDAGITLAVLAGLGIALPWNWRASSPERRARLGTLVPRNRGDAGLWVATSFVAGIGEEIIYRGVLFTLVWRLTNNAWIAALASAASFAAAHFVQGKRAMLVVAAVALLLQVLAWRTGALYASMFVHTAYDLTAGWMYGRWFARDAAAAAPESASTP